MQFNLADLWECVVDHVPDREAIVCGPRRLTFSQAEERSNRLAHALAARGTGKDDRVGLYLYNGSEYVEGSLAAHKIRAVPINVNYRYVEDELRYLFKDAGLKALVFHREFAPKIAAVRAEFPGLSVFLHVEDGSTADVSALGSMEYEAALAAAPPARDFAERSADDLYVLYTGGTTGMPKGVMWRQEDLFMAALGGGNIGGPPLEKPEEIGPKSCSRPQFIMIPAAPLMHGSAQWAAFIALYSGDKIVIPTGKKFDPDQIWRLVGEEKVNQFALVGDAMARPLAEQLANNPGKYDTSTLFVVGSGGAVFSQAVKKQFLDQLPNAMIFDGFGGSEVGHQGTGTGEAAAPRFRVDDRTGVFDPATMEPIEPGSGKVGRLGKCGNIPLGYWNDPEKTAKTFFTIGGKRWVLPGDMASIEADGTITLFGRESVCINSGGEKIFTEEVEAALRSHDKVFDAIVVGVPDERWGQRVAAVVQARAGEAPTLDELVAHCRTRIAGYKVPRQLHLVNELVRQPSGKPDFKWAKAIATGETPPAR